MAQQAARREPNRRLQDIYYKDHAIARDKKKEWEHFNAVEAKLQKTMMATVAPHKKSLLWSIYTFRQWLQGLKTSTSLPDATMKQNIQLQYRKFVNVALLD